jgi:hypothetical protein
MGGRGRLRPLPRPAPPDEKKAAAENRGGQVGAQDAGDVEAVQKLAESCAVKVRP